MWLIYSLWISSPCGDGVWLGCLKILEDIISSQKRGSQMSGYYGRVFAEDSNVPLTVAQRGRRTGSLVRLVCKRKSHSHFFRDF